MPTYRNLHTGQVIERDEPMERYERSQRWETIGQPDATDASPNVTGGPQRPAESDRKSEWVEYAGSLGIDTDGFTKDELIERCTSDGAGVRDE